MSYSFRRPRLHTFLAALTVVAGIIFVVSRVPQINGVSIHLLDVPVNDAYQIYFDVGHGYREDLSDLLYVFPSDTSIQLDFSLPVSASDMRRIRFDLGTGPGAQKVKKVSFVHVFLFVPITLAEWDGEHLAGAARNLHAIDRLLVEDGVAIMVASGQDPYFDASFDQEAILASAKPAGLLLTRLFWLLSFVVAASAIYRYDGILRVIRIWQSRAASHRRDAMSGRKPGTARTRSFRRITVYYFILFVGVSCFLYVLAETYAQLFPKLHRFQEGASFELGLKRFLDRQHASSNSVADYLKSQSTLPNSDPLLGWDSNPQIFNSPDYEHRKEDSMPVRSVIFLGDSVTEGRKNVEPRESFPALLASRLDANIRVVNLAVAGYGIDQMALKAEQNVASHDPSLIVFSFIPHDVLRAGANFIYDRPKPKFRFVNETLTVSAPVSAGQFYLSYYNSKRHFYLSFWLANHYVENREFFFPETYSEYYVSVAKAVARILQNVAERLDVPVLLIKLTNTTPYPGLETLENEVVPIFEAAEAKASLLHFHDIDECTREMAKRRGLRHYNTFYAHPGASGHLIYAECTEPLIKTFLPQGEDN